MKILLMAGLMLVPVAAVAEEVMPDDMVMPGDKPAVVAPQAKVLPARQYPAPTQAELKAAFPDLHGMDMGHHMDPGSTYHQVLVEQLEGAKTDSASSQHWDAKAWWGTDSNRLWLRTEGERQAGVSQDLETQLLWGHAASAWWDSLLGLRQDGGQGPARTWLALGTQGQTPWFFHAIATVFAGKDARVAGRLELEDDWLLSDRLILQPRLELNGYGQADPARGLAAGFSDDKLGLRLRYEIRRELAPYAGVEWRYRRGLAGVATDEEGGWRAVAGLRFWF
jgi:copper resistance protein B